MWGRQIAHGMRWHDDASGFSNLGNKWAGEFTKLLRLVDGILPPPRVDANSLNDVCYREDDQGRVKRSTWIISFKVDQPLGSK